MRTNSMSKLKYVLQKRHKIKKLYYLCRCCISWNGIHYDNKKKKHGITNYSYNIVIIYLLVTNIFVRSWFGNNVNTRLEEEDNLFNLSLTRVPSVIALCSKTRKQGNSVIRVRRILVEIVSIDKTICSYVNLYA